MPEPEEGPLEKIDTWEVVLAVPMKPARLTEYKHINSCSLMLSVPEHLLWVKIVHVQHIDGQWLCT